MKLLIEIENKEVMDKIHKSVADISHILVVNRNIEEIIFSLIVLINLLKQESLIILVWDVFDHNSGPRILAILDSLNIDDKIDMIRTGQRRLRIVILYALMRFL